MTIRKKIIADYTAPTDQTADANQAFIDARDAGVAAGAEKFVLSLERPITYQIFNEIAETRPAAVFDGPKDIEIDGCWAMITDHVDHSGPWGPGALGVVDDNVSHARIATVAAGATVLEVIDGNIARFSEGDVIMVAGLSVQAGYGSGVGNFSSPNSFHYVEQGKTILDITTNFITIDKPLKYAYRDDWPFYNEGDGGHPASLGPAGIFKHHPSWNSRRLLRKLRMNTTKDTATGISLYGRFSIVDRCITSGPDNVGLYPGVAECVIYRNGTIIDGYSENDKLIELQIFDNITHTGNNDYQSSSIDTTIAIDSDFGVSNFGKILRAYGTHYDQLGLGPTSFGVAEECTLINCDATVVNVSARLYKGEADGGVNNNPGFSLVDGTFTFPTDVGGEDVQPWAVPGACVFWAGQFFASSGFRVVSVTQSGHPEAAVTTVTTNKPSMNGFPTIGQTAGKIYLQCHPAPRFTARNGTGALARYAGHPENAPWGSYDKLTFTQAASASNELRIVGDVVHIKVNVTQAYTGAQGTLTANFNISAHPNGATAVNYQFAVDLEQTGERVITPAGVTGTKSSGAGLAGDSGLALPHATTWLTGTMETSYSTDISGDAAGLRPIFSIEVLCDQGFGDTTPTVATHLAVF